MDKGHSAQIIAEYSFYLMFKSSKKNLSWNRRDTIRNKKKCLSPKLNTCYKQGLSIPMILLFYFIFSKYSFSQALPTLHFYAWDLKLLLTPSSFCIQERIFLCTVENIPRTMTKQSHIKITKTSCQLMKFFFLQGKGDSVDLCLFLADTKMWGCPL